MATVANPSPSAEDLFDDDDMDDEEVVPAGAGTAPTVARQISIPGRGFPNRNRKGRPVFKPTTEKGEGLFRCGNCQHLKTAWRRNTDKSGPRKSCADFGIKEDSKPCSFSLMDPLRKFNPITFGDVGIGPDMSLADINLTRILLNRREEELLIAASMPFAVGDKVQFIHQNKYTVGFVESFNRHYVYVRTKDASGTETVIPMTVGSVTKA